MNLIHSTFVIILSFAAFSPLANANADSEITGGNNELYKIDSKVQAPDTWPKANGDWRLSTSVIVDGGLYRGYLREDGSFTVYVPPGIYVIEVSNPSFYYEPVRVDVNSKGKIRARKLNHVQPNAVTQVQYPLKFKSMGAFRYFQQREQWRVTDLLFSPMVIMMFLPLILIFVLPKMMNDPETRKEMENMQLPKYEMPEMSEMLTSFFGGGEAAKKNKQKAVTKRKP